MLVMTTLDTAEISRIIAALDATRRAGTRHTDDLLIARLQADARTALINAGQPIATLQAIEYNVYPLDPQTGVGLPHACILIAPAPAGDNPEDSANQQAVDQETRVHGGSAGWCYDDLNWWPASEAEIAALVSKANATGASITRLCAVPDCAAAIPVTALTCAGHVSASFTVVS